MTDLAAALLKDVPIRGRLSEGRKCLDELVLKKDVLAALSAHLDADLAERVGGIVSELREVAAVFTKDTVFTDAADLITALLAQNAALRAERDGFKQWSENWRYSAQRCLALAEKQEARLTAAEAEVEKLRGALGHIESMAVHSGGEIHGVTAQHWKAAFEEAQYVARAALTTEERHE